MTPADPPSYVRPFALMLALLAAGLAPAPPLGGLALRVREATRSDGMSAADYERMERGYYEQLIDVGRQLGTPVEPTPTVQAPFDAGPLSLMVDDLREFVLKPDFDSAGRWKTNAFGMRDRAYERAKPPGTVRIGLVGDSIASGWGVGDEEGFDPLVERSLDARSRSAGGPAVEILNCAVPGHAPGQRWEHFGRVGWPMAPDLVVYEATTADPGWDARRLRGLLPRGVGWDAPQYREALARAGARPGADADAIRMALRTARWDLLANVYRTIAADCRARGVPAVWVLIPRVGKAPTTAEREQLKALARRAGFTAVVDLSDTFDGLDPKALAIGPKDYHPNAEGHALLARRLEEALLGRPEVQRLLSGPGPGADPR